MLNKSTITKNFTVAAFIGITGLVSAFTATAQDGVNISGLFRIHTMFNENGTCHQNLPNIIANIKKDGLQLDAVLKATNMQPSQGCFAQHDVDLFFFNTSYKHKNTTIRIGQFSPFELTQVPLDRGFTPVLLGGSHVFYGGLVGGKIDHRFPSDGDIILSVNGGAATKPDWLQGFGSGVDLVSFAGIDLNYNLFSRSTLGIGYEAVYFQDSENPEGVDHYAYTKLDAGVGPFDMGIYAEGVTGRRCSVYGCTVTDKYSLSGSVVSSVIPGIAWQMAAGLRDGVRVAETSLHWEMTGNCRSTFGVGRNFDMSQNVARTGLLCQF